MSKDTRTSGIFAEMSIRERGSPSVNTSDRDTETLGKTGASETWGASKTRVRVEVEEYEEVRGPMLRIPVAAFSKIR